MKKFRNYSLAMLLLAGGMTLASCSSDENEENVQNKSEMYVVADYPELLNEGTRSIMDEDYKMMWSASDKLTLFTTNTTNDGFDMVSSNRSKPSYRAFFAFLDSEEKRRFENAKSFAGEETFAVAAHGPKGMIYEKEKNRIKMHMGFDYGNGMNTQELFRNNIANRSDLMVSYSEENGINKKCPISEVNTNGSNTLKFKRISAILRIKLVPKNDNVKQFLNYEFKGRSGEISTCGNDFNFENEEIYHKNNFGGTAYVSLNDDDLYNVTKKDGRGIKFVCDQTQSEEDYFYSGETDDYINISVLPTKLEAGKSFCIIIRDGDTAIKRRITLEKPLEFKSGYSYRLNIGIDDGNIYF